MISSAERLVCAVGEKEEVVLINGVTHFCRSVLLLRDERKLVHDEVMLVGMRVVFCARANAATANDRTKYFILAEKGFVE